MSDTNTYNLTHFGSCGYAARNYSYVLPGITRLDQRICEQAVSVMSDADWCLDVRLFGKKSR